MKRALKPIFAMLMAGLIAAGLIGQAAAQAVPAPGQSPTVDAIKKQGKLRAGVAIAWPWLGQDPKTGKYIGAAADLGQKIADTLGVPLEFVPSGWDVIIAGLQARQFELALAPLFATPKRMAAIDFANYAEGGTCYSVLKTNTKVNSLADLNRPDVTTGVFTGTGTEQEFVKKYPKAKVSSVVQAPGGGTRVLEVISGRLDAGAFELTAGAGPGSQIPADQNDTRRDRMHCAPGHSHPHWSRLRQRRSGLGEIRDRGYRRDEARDGENH